MKIIIEITPEEFIKIMSKKNKSSEINNNEIELPSVFTKWIESYWCENITGGFEFQKEIGLISCRNYQKHLKGISSSMFKRMLIKWCTVFNYDYADRIMKNILISDGRRKTVEFIRITKK